MIDDAEWEPYFAIIPVRVDAYDIREIRNGKMNYLKVSWVKRRLTCYVDEDGSCVKLWKYRP